MAEYTGVGRMSIFPLLWDWQTQARVVVGYTRTGPFGSTAVLGVIPTDVEGEPGDLFRVMARLGSIKEWRGGTHDQTYGHALACLGAGAVVVPKPGTLTAPSVGWKLIGTRAADLDSPYWGHTRVVAGRMSLTDADLEAQARALIQRESAAARSDRAGAA